MSEYNYPLFDYEHEYLEESGALWDDYAAMNQSVYENTDANGPQSPRTARMTTLILMPRVTSPMQQRVFQKLAKRSEPDPCQRLAERADGSEQLPDDDELDADDETPPPRPPAMEACRENRNWKPSELPSRRASQRLLWRPRTPRCRR